MHRIPLPCRICRQISPPCKYIIFLFPMAPDSACHIDIPKEAPKVIGSIELTESDKQEYLRQYQIIAEQQCAQIVREAQAREHAAAATPPEVSPADVAKNTEGAGINVLPDPTAAPTAPRVAPGALTAAPTAPAAPPEISARDREVLRMQAAVRIGEALTRLATFLSHNPTHKQGTKSTQELLTIARHGVHNPTRENIDTMMHTYADAIGKWNIIDMKSPPEVQAIRKTYEAGVTDFFKSSPRKASTEGGTITVAGGPTGVRVGGGAPAAVPEPLEAIAITPGKKPAAPLTAAEAAAKPPATDEDEHPYVDTTPAPEAPVVAPVAAFAPEAQVSDTAERVVISGTTHIRSGPSRDDAIVATLDRTTLRVQQNIQPMHIDHRTWIPVVNAHDPDSPAWIAQTENVAWKKEAVIASATPAPAPAPRAAAPAAPTPPPAVDLGVPKGIPLPDPAVVHPATTPPEFLSDAQRLAQIAEYRAAHPASTSEKTILTDRIPGHKPLPVQSAVPVSESAPAPAPAPEAPAPAPTLSAAEIDAALTQLDRAPLPHSTPQSLRTEEPAGIKAVATTAPALAQGDTQDITPLISHAPTGTREVLITTAEVNFRAGHGLDAKILDKKLPLGTTLHVLNDKNNKPDTIRDDGYLWYRVQRTDTGQEGWIARTSHVDSIALPTDKPVPHDALAGEQMAAHLKEAHTRDQ